METENIIKPPIPNPVVQPAPSVSSASPKTSNKLIILIVLFIIIAIVGFVAYTFGAKSHPAPTPQPTPLAVVQPTPTADPTADWKTYKIDPDSNWSTYKNEKFGFEFEFPDNWIKQHECLQKPFCLQLTSDDSLMTAAEYQKTQGGSFYFTPATKEGYQEFQSSIDKGLVPKGQLFQDWFLIRVAGRNAIQFRGFYEPSGEYVVYTIIPIKKVQIFLSIALPQVGTDPQVISRIEELKKGDLTSEDNQIISDYTKILSTFRFID